MRNKIIILITVLCLAIAGLFLFQAAIGYEKTIKELQAQTISGQLEIIRAEARKLENEKKDYEAKGIDKKLDELYAKSRKLQNLNSTGFQK